MSEQQDTFGTLLRAARQRAGFRTRASWVNRLSELGYDYTDEAVGHWETGRRKPRREVLLVALRELAERGGITDRGEASRMLWLLGVRELDAGEEATFLAALPRRAPANLPERRYDQLIGRREIVDTLAARLADPRDKPVIVLSGLGGIGKTAIGYELVQQVMQDGLFESMAWEGARSEEFVGVGIQVIREQPLDWETILIGIARQLGCLNLMHLPPEGIRSGLREHIAANSVLIVIDNLETVQSAHEVGRALYQMLSPSRQPRPSRALITSRERLAEFDFVYDHAVTGLSRGASMELLEFEARQRGADALVGLGDDFQERIFSITGGMPLALKLIVSQQLLGIALDAELDRLQEAVGEEELYRFIYLSLWEKLSEPAQQMLVGGAVFGGTADQDILIDVSGIERSAFHRAFGELARASLMHVSAHPLSREQRYEMHPMTRWFVNAPLAAMWEQQRRGSPPSPPSTA